MLFMGLKRAGHDWATEQQQPHIASRILQGTVPFYVRLDKTCTLFIR